MFNSRNYEQLSDNLQTSGEILYAIESVTGEDFQILHHSLLNYDENEHIMCNAAFSLWENGGREDEILAALPTEDGGAPIADGREIYWGFDGKFAEFDGEKWKKIISIRKYEALCEYSKDDKIWHGEMTTPNIKPNVVSIEGETLEALREDFANAIEDYKNE